MKQLITAETIKEARQTGARQVTVSPGALITPQAKDDAKLYGIAFVDGGQAYAQAPEVLLQSPLTQPASYQSASPALSQAMSPVGLQGSSQSFSQGMPQEMARGGAQGMSQGVPQEMARVSYTPPPPAYAPAPLGAASLQQGGPIYHSWSAHGHMLPQAGMHMPSGVQRQMPPEAHMPSGVQRQMSPEAHMPSGVQMMHGSPLASPAHMQVNTQQNRVVMNNTSPTQSTVQSSLDAATQQLVEQVLAAVAGVACSGGSVSHPTVQHVMQAPIPQAQGVQGQGAASLTAAVMQRLSALLAPQGGLSAFPALESTIAGVVAELSGQGQAAPMQHTAPAYQAAPIQHTAPAYQAAPVHAGSASSAIGGVDMVPFASQQPTSRVQGEVNIEEALLAHDNASGPGVTRFSFADTSLVWTFTHHEVLVVTHGTVEVKGSAHESGHMLTQGAAMRVAPGTSVTLVAHGSASCVCAAWPTK